MEFEEKDLPPATREELHEQSEQKMMEPGLVGDAWRYIYEITSPVNAEKSQSWVKGMFNRAANDPNIASVKRQVYFDASASLVEDKIVAQRGKLSCICPDCGQMLTTEMTEDEVMKHDLECRPRPEYYVR